MKTIGIVGGIAWPSSIVYYRIINELVAQRLGDGGLHSASLVLAQTDFEEVERNQREGRWDLVGDLLAEQGNKLKADLVRRGAQAIILGCTEFGMLLEAGDSPVPLIDTTLAHAQAAVEMALQE